jgi:formate hydrogenlyase subunit 5
MAMTTLLADLPSRIAEDWPGLRPEVTLTATRAELRVPVARLSELCGWLFRNQDYAFGALIVEEGESSWQLRYVFYGRQPEAGWVHVLVEQPLAQTHLPTITAGVAAADWHEREVDDLFGLHFEGHPYLGDFVLHDDAWQEDVEPMRSGFDARAALAHRAPDAHWRPHRILHAPGAFAMPIGPVYSAVTESAHFLLETVGEDVVRALPRLFYDWRAVEKIAQGRSVDDALLLAERFAATTALAHALAFAQAAESIAAIAVPARAQALRVGLAELERLRHHAGAIADLCESTALAVAASQASMVEEELLRLSGALAGHRYLFGLVAVGGLTRNFDDAALRDALAGAAAAVKRLDQLERRLRLSSSFLDRLEQVGIISQRRARALGLVGPLARASGVARDLRRAQPYAGYAALDFDVPFESEGDGYARLRVLFAEARQSLRLIQQAWGALPAGPVCAPRAATPAGAALGWVEAPRGAALHWLRVDADQRVVRWRVVTPSFSNWPGFRIATEHFAFQDFPIILASLALSVAENDR